MALKPKMLKKTVTTAGTAERLTTSDIQVPGIIIQGLPANTNDVYVGDVNVSSTTYGVALDARDAVTITAEMLSDSGDHISLKDVWIDVDTSGEGVTVLYMVQE